MRVVFQAGSLGKDHWENIVIFFFSIKHWTASSISGSLSFPLVTLQPTSGINTCSPWEHSQNAWPLCPLCHWGSQTGVSATFPWGLAAKTSIIRDSRPRELYHPPLQCRLPCHFQLPSLLHLCSNCYFLQQWPCYHWFCLPMTRTPHPRIREFIHSFKK